MPQSPHDVPVVYNLFPSLAGEIDQWMPHVQRAADMGFNWLFLNPIHPPGASGSLYAVQDYARFNPAFLPYDNFEAQKARFARFVAECRELGVEVMADLVVNHTAYDNPLTRTRRDWYKQNPDGSIRSPGAVDANAPGGYVTWGDLSEIDNEHSPARDELWEYWWKLVAMYLGCGVRGFRADAAYQVPADLWRLLVDRAKNHCSEARFFAETLGCPLEDTLELGRIHDFVFNSGKWWNYRDDWFLDQANRMADAGVRSLGFPESHDTARLAEEWDGDRDRIRQHYLFSALASTGVMTVVGFEYGFRKKPHVVHTRPADYEGARFDLTDFIREANALKFHHPVLGMDGRLERVDTGGLDGFEGDVLVLAKRPAAHAPAGADAALLIFNRADAPARIPLSALFARANAPAPTPQTAAPSAASPAASSTVSPPPEGAPQTLRLARHGAAVFRLNERD